jgi:cell division septation protein DedD
MRFEVKGGGIAAILFALTMLSGAVFVLGLLAGYDVGRQAQLDTAQLATSYPLQSPPSPSAASNESPAEPANPPARSASGIASPAAGGGMPVAAASATGSRDFAGDSISPKHKPSQRLAVSSNPSAAESSSSMAGSPGAGEGIGAAESENPEATYTSSGASSNANPQAGRRVASTARSVRHKPYNIQIEAAMDISGADKMMARLQKLGYPSHLVPTEIAGQRWYKVEVGPYTTAEEASNAEAELRQKYNATYGGVARGNSSGQPSADDNPEE